MNHQGDVAGGPGSGFWILNLLLIAAAGYAVAVRKLSVRGDHWSVRRSTSVATGLCLLAAGILPAPPAMGFSGHVVQHLLLAMLAPLLLALSAPMTLALRTTPANVRRALLSILHSRVSRAVMTAPVVLVLNVGGAYVYYLTPLYDLAHQQPWVQGLANLHMFLAGCLLSWYVIGRDPVPIRARLRTVLIVLLLAAASHDLLAKLLYAQQLPAATASPEQINLGAQIMYYGGSITELLLAILVMSNWYQRTGRQLTRERRRSGNALLRSQREGIRSIAPTKAQPRLRPRLIDARRQR
jgi:putative membrane protein